MESWTKIAENFERILNWSIEHTNQNNKLEIFVNNCFKKDVRVACQILIGNYVPLFKNTMNFNDVYLYNIDVNVNEFSENSINI